MPRKNKQTKRKQTKRMLIKTNITPFLVFMRTMTLESEFYIFMFFMKRTPKS